MFVWKQERQSCCHIHRRIESYRGVKVKIGAICSKTYGSDVLGIVEYEYFHDSSLPRRV